MIARINDTTKSMFSETFDKVRTNFQNNFCELFGAQAAARHYFRTDAAALGAMQAARLAVMLPAPKRFEKRPNSAYVIGRAGTIAARMGAIDPP